MNLQITGRHFSVTDGLREHIKNGTKKLDNHAKHIHDTNIVLALNHMDNIVECTVKTDIKVFFCQIHSDNMYKSIDQVFSRLERQIRKYLKKSLSPASHDRITNHLLDGNHVDEDHVSNDHHAHIHHYEAISPKPMTPQEAILQIEATKKECLLFLNVETSPYYETFIVKNKETDNKSYTLFLSEENKEWQKQVITTVTDGSHKFSDKAKASIIDETMDDAYNIMGDKAYNSHIFYNKNTGLLSALYRKEGRKEVIFISSH